MSLLVEYLLYSVLTVQDKGILPVATQEGVAYVTQQEVFIGVVHFLICKDAKEKLHWNASRNFLKFLLFAVLI